MKVICIDKRKIEFTLHFIMQQVLPVSNSMQVITIFLFAFTMFVDDFIFSCDMLNRFLSDTNLSNL